MGVTDVRQLRFPDQTLETIRLTEVIGPLGKDRARGAPCVVYCQYGGDINRDHQILFKAALVATRPTEDFIEAVYAFDTASSTEWAYPANLRAGYLGGYSRNPGGEMPGHGLLRQ